MAKVYVRAIIKNALSLYFRQLHWIILSSLLYAILLAVAGVFLPTYILFLFNICALLFFEAAATFVGQDVYLNNEKPSWRKGWLLSSLQPHRVLLASLIFIILTLLGFIFLILPGFFALMSLFCLTPVVLLQKGSILQSIKESFYLSRNYRVEILLASFFLSPFFLCDLLVGDWIQGAVLASEDLWNLISLGVVAGALGTTPVILRGFIRTATYAELLKVKVDNQMPVD